MGGLSGPGGGATGNTPEDRASGGNSSSGIDVNGNGPGPEYNSAPTGNTGTDSLGNQGGGDTAMARNFQGGTQFAGSGGVGLGNEGHVAVKPYIHALVIPPSGSSDPASCYNQAQNFVGSLPSVVVGFGSSAQGPSEHFEKYTVDSSFGSSCGIRGILCHYWVVEGLEKKKIETDFIHLQAFYTAKPGDLYYPYTNVAPEIPDPFNLGLNPPKPDLSGKYQSDVVTLDCKDLAQKREEEGINFDHVENLLLKIPEPSQMMMPPR